MAKLAIRSTAVAAVTLLAATANATEYTLTHVYDPASTFVVEDVAPPDPAKGLYRLAYRTCNDGWNLLAQWSRARGDGKHLMNWRIVCTTRDAPAP